MGKQTILTGIRSNGELTLGNYLGAILPMVNLQKEKAGEYQLNFFVPDLHSFTTDVNHATLYKQTLENLRIFVAAGLDLSNADTYMYRQSFIPAHSELFTILNNFAYFGELSRMTQFKEKTGDIFTEEEDVKKALAGMIETNKDFETEKIIDYVLKIYEGYKGGLNISSGLFTYPVLMAADILLYGAKYVPVGDDQRQHLELTRELAIRMNQKFSTTALYTDSLFTVPATWNEQQAFYNRDTGLRIRSLRNPDKKMSKSISDPAGTILLTDTPSEATKKIMSATTDSFGEIQYDFKERPGISNLLQILAVITNQSQSSVNAEWQGKTAYGDLKKAVAAAVEQFLLEFQANLVAVNEKAILDKLEHSEAHMREATAQTLENVQKAVGLRA